MPDVAVNTAGLLREMSAAAPEGARRTAMWTPTWGQGAETAVR